MSTPSARIAERPALRVGIALSAPWALAEDLCLDGIEVREARRYAHWLGRELHWRHITPGQLPQALQGQQLDLAIGGLCATPALRASGRLVTFATKRLGVADCPRGIGYRHVWAVSRGAWRDWASVNAFLQLVRHRAGGDAVATQPATAGREIA